MAIDGKLAKEETIRSVVQQCLTLQEKQGTILRELFARSPETAGGELKPTPVIPNVLDEIINQLTFLAGQQEALILFIQEEITHKI